MSILSSPNPYILYRETHPRIPGPGPFQPKPNGLCPDWIRNNNEWKKRAKRDVKAHGLWPEASKPSTLEMVPIRDCEHFDQILDIANQLSQPIVVDWMASWCRKCIFMKPKLEKIAAEYDTKLKFYCVDVNKVPQALVKRGNISKMPTIQIWKDGEMKAEVIGGHKAWLVVEEVRAMIQQFV